MKPTVGPLLPPNTPPNLPHGLERGGVFDAAYVPATYIDAVRTTVPTDSPISPDVSVDIFTSPVPFYDPNRPRAITGMGQIRQARPYIQGMGPQRGFERISADAPPLPIHMGRPVARPHGTTEGGIFGRQHVVGGMAIGPRVPGVRTMDVIDERRSRALTGFGAGPDGLG